METIDIVIKHYNFLNDVFTLTQEPILLSDKNLKPFKTKIVKYQTELKALGVIDTVDKKIIWKASHPTIELAYDFYYAIQKKNKTFAGIKAILENPENYSSAELNEAIALNGYYRKETGKSIVESEEDYIIELEAEKPVIKPQQQEIVTLFSPEFIELKQENLKLRKDMQELQTAKLFLLEEKKLWEKKAGTDDLGEVKEFLSTANQFLLSISTDTHADIQKLEALQGSFRKVIGMLTSIQLNLVQGAKVQCAILLELQYEFMGTSVHQSIDSRKENLKNALQIASDLIKYNDGNSKYMNNGNGNNGNGYVKN